MKFRFFACVLCMVMMLFMLFGCSNDTEETVAQPTSATSSEEPQTQSDRVEFVISTPDETGARLGKITGYVQQNSVSSKSFPHQMGEGALTVVSVGKYTGPFIEDGTDVQVDSVAAVVVQNTGDKPIQHATVNLSTGEEKLYTFSLATLPVGTSALVLETDKKFLAEDREITAFSADVTKSNEFETNSSKVEVTCEDGIIKLCNLTDTDFRGVYVRYKNFTVGNVYFGGITYSASFDNVAAGGSYEYKAAHFYKDYSQVLMVQIIE